MYTRVTLADAGLRAEHRAISGPQPCRAMVVEPTRKLVIDRARLLRLRAGDLASDVDTAIVASIVSSPSPVDVLLFRAHTGQPDHCWGFADNLTPAEVDELGVEIMRSHLALYRRLVAHGVYAFIGTDLGSKEHEAIRRGNVTVASELERKLPHAAASESGSYRLDLWLLDHLALWITTPLEQYVADGLGAVMKLVQRRRRELDALRAGLQSETENV